MKHLKSLLAVAMFSFLLVSCTQDNEATDASLDLTTEINVHLKEQKAKAAFDSSSKGLYHGFFTSGMAQSNGRIWINLGNDGRYNALVEIDGGGAYTFELAPQAEQSNLVHYQFVNEAGSFKMDVTNPLSPKVTDASLNGLIHLGTPVKVTSRRVPTTITGTYAGDLSGTWNLIANGGDVDPGNPGQEIITSVEVTYDSDGAGPNPPIMKIDTTFEPTTGADCVLGANVAYTGGFDPNDVSANLQSSDFGGQPPGLITSWNLFFNGVFGGYFSAACAPAASGNWSRGIQVGTITITP